MGDFADVDDILIRNERRQKALEGVKFGLEMHLGQMREWSQHVVKNASSKNLHSDQGWLAMVLVPKS